MNNESILPPPCPHPLGRGTSLTLIRAILLVPLMLLAVAPTGWPVLLYDNGEVFGGRGGATSDFSASRQTGDDFTLSMAGTAQEIQWWGFYVGSTPTQDDFMIRFFSFTGGTPDVTPFASYAIGNNVTRTDTGLDAVIGPNIYQYSATIPDTALAAGTPYLLSIVNNTDTTSNFLWSVVDGLSGSWSRASNGESWTASFSNLAFNISGTVASSVPEGGTSAVLLGVAFLAIFAFRWRLRFR